MNNARHVDIDEKSGRTTAVVICERGGLPVARWSCDLSIALSASGSFYSGSTLSTVALAVSVQPPES